MRSWLWFAALFFSSGLIANEPKLIEQRRIWDRAPHNAFTDLIRFQDRWFCVFREGQNHVSPDGALRIITSQDGNTWESAALIQSTDSDLRDAKITIANDGRLMLSGAAALHDKTTHTHQSKVWFSKDGFDWSPAIDVGDRDYWLWRTTWHKNVAYGIGYGCSRAARNLRLYQSEDGSHFRALVPNLYDQGEPNETSLVFGDGDLAYCLLRREAKEANGFLGVAEPPYTRWEWKDLGSRIGGPHLIRIPDGRMIAAVRLYQPKTRTALCWIDPIAGKMTEFLTLPSGGDTSYAGLVWHDGLLWVSYYSSHEGKTSIYLAKVDVGADLRPVTPSKLPNFPRVTTANVYRVDPFWPQKPTHYQWEAMPGIAVDHHNEHVWIFTRSKSPTPPVQVYSTDGSFVRAWGTDVIGSAHHLKIGPTGNVWISDIDLHVVREFTPDGKLLRTLGTPGEKGCDATHLNMPTDMAVTKQGDVFVSDGYGNNRIVHFDSKGTMVKEWGKMGVGADEFSLPHAIDMDSQGRLYIADRNNQRIQVYDQDGKRLDSWQNLIVPWGFCITPEDEIWVCGSSPMPWRVDPNYPTAPLGCPPYDQIVMKFDTRGKLLQLTSFPKGMDGKEYPGDLNWVHSIAVDRKGNLYLGDIIGKRAQKFMLRK